MTYIKKYSFSSRPSGLRRLRGYGEINEEINDKKRDLRREIDML